jgi:NTP pyrophosphatase (non-canonical NTP hydrolase)
MEIPELEQRVLFWAQQRNLLNADEMAIKSQTLKLVEEVGELTGAILKDRPEAIIDSLGDIQVVLIILHAQLGLYAGETLEHAYEEIKNRTGETVNGVFRKSESVDRS